MPETRVFICGAVLMALSAGAFAQPTPAIIPSAEVASAASGREPAAAAVPSTPTADTSESVPINPGAGLTGGQLEALQARTLLLEAQVQAARLQKELTTTETAGAGENGPAAGPFAMNMPADVGATPVQAAPAATRLPGRITVLEVSGRGNALQATLSFPDGRRSVVKAGNTLPGSTLTVKAISLSGVTLSDGQQLTF
ncbi:type IV pilus biogenesis protein PilP [Salmonella enterica]|uniref:type IV pilus biogenesis protein PilP n=1 Tax=Salmonella enterica TaxID=28901 RepID=UPI0009AC9B2A|nr:type IV pilus biogenesis protein PilP [Salmonella enterica]EAA2778371.1 type IV pilus biogenesis protein PilP [Salmonella enterica subsp. enterica serovar Montevideo]EDL3361631.1 type IV pilus biogenesis protein PilP [Salmonella enterica subsp. enterica serovar Brandenburg]EDQ5840281.1 type IV pilus biogenesis protein PilP [Salmonella enterica subsp. enterica]EAM4396803.1 type IV pilus biogenesis protein PilP [Salmonella enterica]ECC5789630.1 type IV pilus biogenesis protein PilP [Salmonell